MSWFSFLKTSDSATPSITSQYSPVRRRIVFSNLTDNLKIGDWLHINIADYDIGRLFYYENGLIKDKVDQDSYIVVYELNDQYTPTYSIILGENSESSYEKNLWFRSVTEVNAGNQPTGNYYVYYHKDNIQYLELATPAYETSTPEYVATIPPSETNFMASISGNSISSVNFYFHEVKADSSNSRIAAVSFLGDPEKWLNQTTSSPGSKIIGSFSGPILKIHAKKGPDFGKAKIRVTKTSATGAGQQVVSDAVEIDCYATVRQDNQEIYLFDVRTLNLFSTYQEIYTDYLFEIEIIEQKNQSSSGNKFTIEKYSFSKNYQLQLDEEEIKPDIAFKSIGGLK